MNAVDPELRGSAPPPAPPRGCNPLRALFRLIVLLLLTVVLLYGIALLVARSDGFRDLLATRLGEELGDSLTLTETRLNPNFTFEVRGVTIPHERATSGCTIARARFAVDWKASFAEKSLVYGRFEATEISLDVTENAEGIREPEALMRLLGLQQWRSENAVDPTESSERIEKVLRRIQESESPQPRRMGRVVVDGHRMEMRFIGVNIRVHDASGQKQAEFVDGVIGIDPGVDPDPVVPAKPRYRIHGSSRFPAGPSWQTSPMAVDLLYNNGEWVLLELEAESRLLFWMKRLLSGEAPGPLTESGQGG